MIFIIFNCNRVRLQCMNGYRGGARGDQVAAAGVEEFLTTALLVTTSSMFCTGVKKTSRSSLLREYM